jgi:hypothetical protein
MATNTLTGDLLFAYPHTKTIDTCIGYDVAPAPLSELNSARARNILVIAQNEARRTQTNANGAFASVNVSICLRLLG